MFVTATGIDSGSDNYAVGVAAASSTLDSLNLKVPNVKPQFVIIFASSQYDLGIVSDGAKTIFGYEAVIMGASSAGEVTELGYNDRPSVVMMAFFSDDVHFVASVTSNIANNESGSAESLSDILIRNSKTPPELLLYLYEGAGVNASKLISGSTNPFGNAFPVVGISSSDNGTFTQTQNLFQQEKYRDTLTGVSLCGELNFAVTTAHGWNPLSVPKSVTSFSGNVVHTINKLPAVSIYEDYLGLQNLANSNFSDFFEIASSYPLGFYDNQTRSVSIRSPKAINPDGSIVFGGDVPENSYVQLMVGTPKEANQSTLFAAKELKEAVPEPAGIIFVSSFIRKSLFGGKVDISSEIAQIQSVFGTKVPIIGTYSYGGYAPSDNTNKTSIKYLDGTVILIALGAKMYG